MEDTLRDGLMSLYENLSLSEVSEESTEMVEKLKKDILDCINDYNEDKTKELLAEISMVSLVLKQNALAHATNAIQFSKLEDKAMESTDQLAKNVKASMEPAKVAATPVQNNTQQEDSEKIKQLLAQLDALKAQSANN